MEYIEFVRPHGNRVDQSISLDARDEKLAQLCLEHEDGIKFTYENCGQFINLCFEAVWEDEDGESEIQDVVCEAVPNSTNIKAAWSMTIAKAADYLQIHVPDMVGDAS